MEQKGGCSIEKGDINNEHTSFPVGKVTMKKLHPLDLEEYLWAVSEQLECLQRTSVLRIITFFVFPCMLHFTYKLSQKQNHLRKEINLSIGGSFIKFFSQTMLL